MHERIHMLITPTHFITPVAGAKKRDLDEAEKFLVLIHTYEIHLYYRSATGECAAHPCKVTQSFLH